MLWYQLFRAEGQKRPEMRNRDWTLWKGNMLSSSCCMVWHLYFSECSVSSASSLLMCPTGPPGLGSLGRARNGVLLENAMQRTGFMYGYGPRKNAGLECKKFLMHFETGCVGCVVPSSDSKYGT